MTTTTDPVSSPPSPAINIPLGQLLGRALRCRCPNCGQGRLYQAYLKPVAYCSVCGESYAEIRADDGPAWLTILIAGHIIIPLFVMLQGGNSNPNWGVMIFCCVFLVALVFGLLPFTKAFFIAVIWHNRNERDRPRQKTVLTSH